MNLENKIFDLIYASAATITTATEYETGRNYETDIGNYLQEWVGGINEESDTIVFEIRDVTGDVGDEQEPYQHEIIAYEFYVAAKKGTGTADFLRKARADIFRMIGANIDAWQSAANVSLKISRGGFDREIIYENNILGELRQTIEIQYIQNEWLIGEPNY